MSDLPQSGQQAGASGRHPDPFVHPEPVHPDHPDVDQLSAFIDHALPAHERNHVLAHLAVCPDCRETVALSMPPAESMPVTEAAPARRRWAPGFAIFVPAAVALAAVALFVAYFHRVPVPKEQARIASLPPSTPILPPVQSSISTGVAASPNPLAGNRGTAPRGPAPVHPSPGKQTGAQPVAPLSAERETIPPSRALLQPLAPPLAGAAAHTTARESNSPGAPDGAQDAGLPKNAAAAAGSASQSFQTANAASPLERGPLEMNNLRGMKNLSLVPMLLHALPSGLSILSSANYGNKVLAIDAQNAVFLSTDSGLHWKAVPAQWQGRPVKASLLSGVAAYGMITGAAPVHGNMAAGNTVLFAGRSRPLTTNLNASLTGVVRDGSGAAIPGATVVLINAATNTSRTATTDASGRYFAGSLPGGAYNLEARAPGFETLHLRGVKTDAVRPNVANLSLTPAAASETVSVEAARQPETRISAARLSSPAATSIPQPIPVFEITTDSGDLWTSTDGLTWKRN